MPDKLDSLAKKIKVCTLCDLHKTRTNAVPGSGSCASGIMFVGEGPGKNEDEQGVPFVGMAGKFLDELLRGIGVQRSEVFITNIVKCRPPGNRDPVPEEIETCLPYLREQVLLLKPGAIVTLGRIALMRLVDPALSISLAHGRVFKKGRINFFASYHPAAALYNKKLESVMREDFAALSRFLKKTGRS
ncbi:MAG: uracil-DNA glycosylase [Chloroflexi bacterium]|nr:uracil-DNA glycosylase [Chloroflexota bacterium]